MIPESTVNDSIMAQLFLQPTETHKNYSGILSTLPLIPETTTANNSIRAELFRRLNESHTQSKIAKIWTKIQFINKEQKIKNLENFGPVTNETVIIVIQIHNRAEYLKHCLYSLSEASNINKTLIIFSHDVWDDAINDLANSVNFAKTMQIFYPFSIQTHPNDFPGDSPNDCPRNTAKEK